MPRYIAFLRAINVGGHTVKMETLCNEFVALGYSGVETFIASGNVIFETKSKAVSALESAIEKRLAATLNYEVGTFIRTPDEVAEIARFMPFDATSMKSAGALVVGFVCEPLSADSLKRLARLKSDIDDFHVHGREVYWLCKMKQSESKFSNAVFEKTVGNRATFRGLNTIRKLAAKLHTQ